MNLRPTQYFSWNKTMQYRGTVEMTNPTDRAIAYVQVWLRAAHADKPGETVFGDLGRPIRVQRGALAPGETKQVEYRLNVPVGDLFEEGEEVITDGDAYTLEVFPGELVLLGNTQEGFYIAQEDQTYLARFDQTLERCEASVTARTDAIASLNQRLEGLASGDIEDLPGMPRIRTSFGSREPC